MELAREGKQRAWWQSLALPYSTYVGLEAAASVIRTYEVQFVPGLLQTEDYARALFHAALPTLDHDAMERRIRSSP